jgi:ethanolamine utilization protein EutA
MKMVGNTIISVFSDLEKLILIFESDVGMGMGRLIKEELKYNKEIISIDEIPIEDYDYVDVGNLIEEINVIPITIKSLVFPKTKFS